MAMPPPSLPDLAKAAWAIFRRDGRVHLALILAAIIVDVHVFGSADVSSFIQKYQALIGTVLTGTLGFWTVNKTLRTNAENAQLQKDRELAHEVKSIKTILIAELSVMQGHLAAMKRVDADEVAEGKYTVSPYETPDQDVAYKTLIAKLGHLEPDEVGTLVWAYAAHSHLMTSLPILQKLEKSQNIREEHGCHEAYVTYLATCEIRVDRAIKVLSGLGEDTPVGRDGYLRPT